MTERRHRDNSQTTVLPEGCMTVKISGQRPRKLTLAVAMGAVVATVIARRMALGFFMYVVLGVTVVGSVSLLVRELLSLM